MRRAEAQAILEGESTIANEAMRKARAVMIAPDDAAVPFALMAIAEQLNVANSLEIIRRAEEGGELTA